MKATETKSGPSIDDLIEAGEKVVSQIDQELESHRWLQSHHDSPPSSVEFMSEYEEWLNVVRKYLRKSGRNALLLKFERLSSSQDFKTMAKFNYEISRERPRPGVTELKEKIMKCISKQVDILEDFRVENLDKTKVSKEPLNTNSGPLKMIIHVDRRLGIFSKIKGVDVFYPKVRPTNKIFKTVLFLVEGSAPSEIHGLALHTKQEAKSVKRSIKSFNNNSRRIFDMKTDPIISTANGMYFANKSDFDFL